MTEAEKIQMCVTCPLTLGCVVDLPLFRHQCPIVQIESSQPRKKYKRKPVNTFAAKVNRAKYYIRTNGAAQKRYESKRTGSESLNLHKR